MKAAFIRLHRFDHALPAVYDAIAEHADGLFFLAHQVTNPAILQAAGRHPKCREIRMDRPKRWTNGGSLARCYKWASEVGAGVVLTFDEDEMPPPRLSAEYRAWQHSGSPMMVFRFVWTYENFQNVILGEFLSWHCKVVRWHPRLAARGVGGYCVPALYRHRAPYRCPYPIRHISGTTAAMRTRRSSTAYKSRVWARHHTVMPNDPNLTISQFTRMERVYARRKMAPS